LKPETGLALSAKGRRQYKSGQKKPASSLQNDIEFSMNDEFGVNPAKKLL
jgi:hypothetical protein